MRNLIDQIIGAAENVIVGWIVPLFLLAVISTIFSVLIAANQIVAAITIAATTIIMAVYCFHRQALWQSIFYGGIGGIYLVLSLVAPEWAIIWGLMITVISLTIIAGTPGAVIPGMRRTILGLIIFSIIVHGALAWATWQSTNVFPLLLALLLMAVGSQIFSQGARPYEMRRAQRSIGRLLGVLGVVLLLVILLSNVPLPNLVPRPVVSLYNSIANKAESYQLSSQREVIGQRAKTESLAQIVHIVTSLHRERWLRETEKIPSFPLSERERKELGIENPQPPSK